MKARLLTMFKVGSGVDAPALLQKVEGRDSFCHVIVTGTHVETMALARPLGSRQAPWVLFLLRSALALTIRQDCGHWGWEFQGIAVI